MLSKKKDGLKVNIPSTINMELLQQRNRIKLWKIKFKISKVFWVNYARSLTFKEIILVGFVWFFLIKTIIEVDKPLL